MAKLSRAEIITGVIFGILSIIISLIVSTAENNLPTNCYKDFRNDSFLKTMKSLNYGDDYIPIQCSNPNSSEYDFNQCIYTNATKHQVDFMHTCQWLGPEYFLGGGKIIFRYAIPIFILIYFAWRKKDD